MPIFCDESGAPATGAMTLAAVAISDEGAEALLARYRAVTGLTGELKGSRIDPIERAYVLELIERFGGEAIISVATPARHPGEDSGALDLKTYSALLADAIGAHLDAAPGPVTALIDDGRYSDATLARVRDEVERLIDRHDPASRAELRDSRRTAGIQIADILANSAWNVATGTLRSARIAVILEPFIANGVIRMRQVKIP
ncbi:MULTISPECIES: DUF3800 domain-containing protein [Edaphosphingomonas]|uniref:DUF3800 domain-containing protein n=2 Tax=Edaphosphingomonas TaxID=3423724 RepID=A0A2T4HYJ0_9SPHN|nr:MULTISPECIES: DUF3800 domain-containing protein [Sphingomonas]OHT19555.1 hypothetical protein BHE75_01542 [Sphingomonas haloaromaticamans]PTD21141.1 hypothetical protein CV103_10675 [Sphingomonas fennica]